jgi:hypothetical protein
MKLTTKAPEPPPPPAYVLEMTEFEAKFLKAMMGQVLSWWRSNAGELAEKFYMALHNGGVTEADFEIEGYAKVIQDIGPQ